MGVYEDVIQLKIISTIILKAKFLPVIKGKNIELETISGTNGIKKIPVIIEYRKNVFKFIL